MTEAAAPIPAGASGSLPLSRREFLYYLWGVSMAVAIAGATGATIWFALPRFKEGEFGGVVTHPGWGSPAAGQRARALFPDGRFWLVNIGEQTISDPRQPLGLSPVTPGVKALYMVCVHLGCLYKWVADATTASSARVTARSTSSRTPALTARPAATWTCS